MTYDRRNPGPGLGQAQVCISWLNDYFFSSHVFKSTWLNAESLYSTSYIICQKQKLPMMAMFLPNKTKWGIFVELSQTSFLGSFVPTDTVVSEEKITIRNVNCDDGPKDIQCKTQSYGKKPLVILNVRSAIEANIVLQNPEWSEIYTVTIRSWSSIC